MCQCAYVYLKDKSEAEEIIQALFSNLWENREQLAIKVSIKAYLYRSIYNNWHGKSSVTVQWLLTIGNKYQKMLKSASPAL
ncbi:MAG: hypothetical protein HC896_05675 [Bacteroidales bacterium]|nr:hypothetical protein [Bacteroidales bacterium]